MSSTVSQYQQLHTKGYGTPARREEVIAIKALRIGTKSKTLIDFGCGSVKDKRYYKDLGFDPDNVTKYDPAIEDYSNRPCITHDGVIAIDVLEHIPENQIDFELNYIFRYALRFVYISIHCGLASTILPNGDNAHCTIKHPNEWREIISAVNENNVPVMITFSIPINPKYDVLNLNRWRK